MLFFPRHAYRTPQTGPVCSFDLVMLFEAALRVIGHANIERSVGAFDDVTEKHVPFDSPQ